MARERPVALPARRDVHLAAAVPRDLEHDVRGGAESIEAEPPAGGNLGAAERAIADDPRAQQGSGLEVRKRLRYRVGERLGDDGELRVSPVGVVPGVPRDAAQVLGSRGAKRAGAASVAQPRDPDALADRAPRAAGAEPVHDPDRLVARDQGEPPRREVALDDVKVGPADRAGANAHPDLARRGLGVGHFGPPEGGVRDRRVGIQHHRPHRSLSIRRRRAGPCRRTGDTRRQSTRPPAPCRESTRRGRFAVPRPERPRCES